MRYTEARLTRYAEVLLKELGLGTVEWVPNFDGTLEEPRLLPRRWTLDAAKPRPLEDLFAEDVTIYVRARYVTTHGRVTAIDSADVTQLPTGRAAASPWTTARLDVKPRALMAKYSVAESVARSNPCAKQASRVSIPPPYPPEIGYARVVAVGGVGPSDTSEDPAQSQLVLCEIGAPLGPAHSQHDEIRNVGAGRFSHWNDYLYFSTSDNSDPNTNGRLYEVVRELVAP